MTDTDHPLGLADPVGAFPERCFRFTDLRWRDTQLAGNLRFASLNYYRLLEVVTGDQWIGDRTEGVGESLLNAELVKGGDQTHLRDKLAQAGLAFQEGSTATVKDVRSSSSFDCYILSLSAGHLGDLEKAMCQAPERENYDACISMGSLADLAQAVCNAPFDGGRVGDAFYVKAGPVIYDRHIHDISVEPVSHGNPLIKDARYKAQAEWRILLIPRDRPSWGDFVHVCVPDLAEAAFQPVEVTSLLPLGSGQASVATKLAPETALEIIRKQVDMRDAGTGWRGTPEDARDLAKAYWALRTGEDLRLDGLVLAGLPPGWLVNDMRARFLPDYGRDAQGERYARGDFSQM